MKVFLFVLLSLVFCVPSLAAKLPSRPIVVAYLGADSRWKIEQSEIGNLSRALDHIDLLNYAFIRFKKNRSGNIVLNVTKQDLCNLKLIRKLRPKLPIIISVGGWRGRQDFKNILSNRYTRIQFIDSVSKTLKQYHLVGIDVDWENERLATKADINGLADLLHGLSVKLRLQGYLVSNAVPATAADWKHYPSPKRWAGDVNWTSIMAYDHYGTFGPTTELASSLYASHHSRVNRHYPYHTTSGNLAVEYYLGQGLPANKILLGVPFYCHSYYINDWNVDRKHLHPGLHALVSDTNISSQVDYKTLFRKYRMQLYQYQLTLGQKKIQASSFYGLIPIEGTNLTQFLSCESPHSIADKMHYIKGQNPMKLRLRGVSFWSLSQDLDYANQHSLLRAINQNLL